MTSNAKTTKIGGTNVKQNRKESDMTNVNYEQLKEQARAEVRAEQKEARQEDIKNQFQLLKAMSFRAYAKAENKAEFKLETKKFFDEFVRNWFINNKAFDIVLDKDVPQEDGSIKHVYIVKDMNLLASGKSKTGKDFLIFAPAMPVFNKAKATA